MATYLFVGGPLNGQTREVDETNGIRQVWLMPVSDDEPLARSLVGPVPGNTLFRTVRYERRNRYINDGALGSPPQRETVFFTDGPVPVRNNGLPTIEPMMRTGTLRWQSQQPNFSNIPKVSGMTMLINQPGGKVRVGSIYDLPVLVDFPPGAYRMFMGGGNVIGRTRLNFPNQADLVMVSTVLLPFDHSFGMTPMLFASMVFNASEEYDDFQVRYSTPLEAMTGHRITVAKLIEAGGVIVENMTEEQAIPTVPLGVLYANEPANDEEAMLRAIDEKPEDDTRRLAFADLLAEKGDPREEGYRAMVHLGIRAAIGDGLFTWYSDMAYGKATDPDLVLTDSRLCGIVPATWLAKLSHEGCHGRMMSSMLWWIDWSSRAECENALALAFSLLSVEDQDEVMKRGSVRV